MGVFDTPYICIDPWHEMVDPYKRPKYSDLAQTTQIVTPWVNAESAEKTVAPEKSEQKLFCDDSRIDLAQVS